MMASETDNRRSGAETAAFSSKKTVYGNTKDEKTKQKQQSNTKFMNANRTKATKLKQDKSALIAVDANYHAEENKKIHHPSSFFYPNTMMFNNTHMGACQPPSPNQTGGGSLHNMSMSTRY
jgi:hypothetical protein